MTAPQSESFVKSHLVDALGITGIVALALTNHITGGMALGAILSIVGARTSIAAWKILRFITALLSGISGGGGGSPAGPSLPPPKQGSDKPEPPSSAFWAATEGLKILGKRAATVPAAVVAYFTLKGGG